jgi:hypothetical protein
VSFLFKRTKPNLKRSDSVSGRDDEVVVAGLEPEVSVLVLRGAVARQVEVAAEGVRGRLLVPQVSLKPPFNLKLGNSDPQCCGSGMFILDPNFYPSRIPDPGSKNSNKRGVKKLVVIPFFVAINITKLKIISFFKCCRKKSGPILKKL